jgi:predicted amidohydrolase YtcJ
MRVDACVALNDYQAEFTTPERSEAVLAKHKELDTPLIDINLKDWADGSPLSKTALLIEAYSDDPSTHGEMTIGPAQFERIIKAHKDGMQVRLHATGDGTTRTLLNLIEKARAADPKSSLRHHIGHLMVVHPDDIPRFKELNVIAEFSPVMWHPTTLGATAKQFVGEKRYSRWMAIKEFIDAGATVTFGSDWPAGTPDADPWRGLEAMITRMDTNTNAGEKLGEGIDLKTAIKVFTINGAKAMMHEDVAGSIEAGKHADMIVLDRNLFEIEPTDISDVKVLKTIFAGKVVYSAK